MKRSAYLRRLRRLARSVSDLEEMALECYTFTPSERERLQSAAARVRLYAAEAAAASMPIAQSFADLCVDAAGRALAVYDRRAAEDEP